MGQILPRLSRIFPSFVEFCDFCNVKQGAVANLRHWNFAVAAFMSRAFEIVFARSGCAFLLGSLGALIVPVGLAIHTALSVYPRSPSSTVWAAVGGTLGFVIGACVGRRRLTGRPAGVVAGLLAGMLLGGLIAWNWAHAEIELVRSQLRQFGAPAEIVAGAENDLLGRGFQTVSLQYGSCLGILAGSVVGWFRNGTPRLSLIPNVFPVLTCCFIALGAIEMQQGFRELSKDILEQARRTWAEHDARLSSFKH